VAKPEGKNHLKDLSVDEKILLKQVFKKLDWGRGIDRTDSEWGQVAVFVNAVINLNVP
jgi:hypothetical protein